MAAIRSDIPSPAPPLAPQLRCAFHDLKSQSERLRLEFLKAELNLSFTIATYADMVRGNQELVESCHKTALKGYHTARAMILKYGIQTASLRSELDHLRTALVSLERPGSSDNSPPSRCANPAAITGTAPGPASGVAPGKDGHHGNARDPLTNREIEVLKRIAEGHTTKQVAGLLRITFKTAACHRYRIMDKLGIHDAVTLARYAIRSGLIQA